MMFYGLQDPPAIATPLIKAFIYLTHPVKQLIALTLNPSPTGRGTSDPAPLLPWEKGLGDEGKRLMSQVCHYPYQGGQGRS